MKLSLYVLTQLTNVTDTGTHTHTDRQTDRQTLHDGIGRAYASHRAAKIPSASCSRSEILMIVLNRFNQMVYKNFLLD